MTCWEPRLPRSGSVSPALSACLVALLLAAPVSAQEAPSGQSFARGMSWGSLGAGVALKVWAVSDSDEKVKEALKGGGALLLTGLSTLAAKTLVHEDRPCAPNDCGQDDPHKAFWSGHVANACAVIPLRSGKAMWITGVALAAITAAGRFIGKEHWLFPDITLGCVDGLLNNWLMSRIR